jgi:DnaJ-domain-containing protein 1
MSGIVRRGPFQGRDLAKLSRDQLLALWRECCAQDEQGAAMLEAYLDREIPDWCQTRIDDADTTTHTGDAMTPEEALAVLGLSPGAGKAEIRAAYRRLMAKLDPENGGSAYLAAKLNQAQEILLRG